MQMTRAEAEQYREEITQKYWNRIVSYKKFSELWDEVELLPYDLSAFSQLKADTVEWIDAISFYAYNDEEMLIYTFTEGDTTLQLFNDREKYEAEKQDMYNFYKAERSA